MKEGEEVALGKVLYSHGSVGVIMENETGAMAPLIFVAAAVTRPVSNFRRRIHRVSWLASTRTSSSPLCGTRCAKEGTGASSLMPVISSTSASAALRTLCKNCSSGSRGRRWTWDWKKAVRAGRWASL